MAFNFILAQLFGLIALGFLVYSFFHDEKEKLLKYQIICMLFCMLQYLFLGAFTGLLMSTMAFVRNIIFSQYKDEKIPLYILFIFLIVIVLLGSLSYKGDITLLPVLANANYTFALWTGNLKLIRLLDIISCSLYIIYDYSSLAYVGMIFDGVELISTVTAFLRFNIKKD